MKRFKIVMLLLLGMLIAFKPCLSDMKIMREESLMMQLIKNIKIQGERVYHDPYYEKVEASATVSLSETERLKMKGGREKIYFQYKVEF